jgi:hypothetical protein
MLDCDRSYGPAYVYSQGETIDILASRRLMTSCQPRLHQEPRSNRPAREPWTGWGIQRPQVSGSDSCRLISTDDQILSRIGVIQLETVRRF